LNLAVRLIHDRQHRVGLHIARDHEVCIIWRVPVFVKLLEHGSGGGIKRILRPKSIVTVGGPGKLIRIGPRQRFVDPGVKRVPIFVIPDLLGLILLVDKHGSRVPIVLFRGRYPPRSKSKIRLPDGTR